MSAGESSKPVVNLKDKRAEEVVDDVPTLGRSLCVEDEHVAKGEWATWNDRCGFARLVEFRDDRKLSNLKLGRAPRCASLVIPDLLTGF